jgi:hypothetical protein
MLDLREQLAYLEVCILSRLCADLVLCCLVCRLVFVELREGFVKRVLQLVGARLFLFELFVEIVVVVLQEALAHSQLPNLLVFRHYLDRVSASFEIEFQSRVS